MSQTSLDSSAWLTMKLQSIMSTLCFVKSFLTLESTPFSVVKTFGPKTTLDSNEMSKVMTKACSPPTTLVNIHKTTVWSRLQRINTKFNSSPSWAELKNSGKHYWPSKAQHWMKHIGSIWRVDFTKPKMWRHCQMLFSSDWTRKLALRSTLVCSRFMGTQVASLINYLRSSRMQKRTIKRP